MMSDLQLFLTARRIENFQRYREAAVETLVQVYGQDRLSDAEWVNSMLAHLDDPPPYDDRLFERLACQYRGHPDFQDRWSEVAR